MNPTPAASMMDALSALESLGTPGLPAERLGADGIRFRVAQVEMRDGAIFVPFAEAVSVTVDVLLSATAPEYRFRVTSFESSGMSVGHTQHAGAARIRRSSLNMTLDGVTPVQFDTGVVIDLIDATLVPLGWSRRVSGFTRFFARIFGGASARS
ncbi:MAG: hypothetical protein ACTJHU_11750 [Mycetocola sp.]